MAVTRADVARRAGVSPAVVSYVLNPGSRPVSADARRRIEEAIRELDYRPNAVAQALRKSSTMSIGLMVPDLANVVIAAIAREIEDIAYGLGYVLFLGTVAHDRAREERYMRSYVDRRVDALIVVGTHRPDVLESIARNGTPVIVLDTVEPGRGLSSVVPESRRSSAAAVRHLIDVHGHTRVACIAGSASTAETAEDRVNGWRDALDDAGLPFDDRMLLRASEFSRAAGHAAGLALPADATAVFVVADVLSVGVVGAIRESGRLVPSDVALVSFDGSELAVRAFPGFTAVDVRSSEIAKVTMERLIAKLGRSDILETHDVTPTELVIRRSCGCDLSATD